MDDLSGDIDSLCDEALFISGMLVGTVFFGFRLSDLFLNLKALVELILPAPSLPIPSAAAIGESLVAP